jgi:hypothetical protein
MRRSHLILFALCMAGYLARGPFPVEANPSANPVAKSLAPAVVDQPAAGANSFTQTQAKERITNAGYSSVDSLTRNSDGIWTGTALKQGRPINVMLDFKGDISEK